MNAQIEEQLNEEAQTANWKEVSNIGGTAWYEWGFEREDFIESCREDFYLIRKEAKTETG